mmetsp:Transcript_28207/g.90209  ORF Transcript_28207/g.90209 Transcript_28207/m.90209 type:complete len:262 (-) Transcript_28207:411-1196(-)
MDRNPTTLIRKAHRGEGSRKFPREAHGHEGLASQRLPRPGRALRLRRRTPRLRRRALLPQPGALHPRARLLVMVALHGAEPAIHQAAREGGEDGFGHCLFGDARGERGDTNLHQGPADDLVHAINPLPADAWTSLLTQRSPPLTGGSTSPLLRRAMPTVTPWARAPRWRRPSRRPTASRTSTAGRPLRVAPLARASSGQPSSLARRWTWEAARSGGCAPRRPRRWRSASRRLSSARLRRRRRAMTEVGVVSFAGTCNSFLF